MRERQCYDPTMKLWREKPKGLHTTVDGKPYTGKVSWTNRLNGASELHEPITDVSVMVWRAYERRLFGRWFPRERLSIIAVFVGGVDPLTHALASEMQIDPSVAANLWPYLSP